MASFNAMFGGVSKVGGAITLVSHQTRLLGRKRNLLILAELHARGAACHLRPPLVQREFVDVLVRVVADDGAAFFIQSRHGVREGHLGGRARSFELARRQIHRPGSDLHRHLGRASHGVFAAFLDHDKRIGLQHIVRAVGKNDARHAVASRLHEVTFFQGGVVVGPDPLQRARLLDAHEAIQVHEVSFPPGGRRLGAGDSSRVSHHRLQPLAHLLGHEARRNQV